jgi:hypothetical protein
LVDRQGFGQGLCCGIFVLALGDVRLGFESPVSHNEEKATERERDDPEFTHENQTINRDQFEPGSPSLSFASISSSMHSPLEHGLLSA